jgi:hypothetical protein
MPIDASIALGVRPPQFESPVNAMAKIMQLKGLQQDQEMNTMRADEYRRGVDRQNRLMGLMQGGSDPEALRRGGFLKEAADWETSSANTGKTKADTRAKEIEATAKRLDIAGQAFGHVRANPTLETAMSTLDYLQQNGVYSPEQVTGFKQAVSSDPSKIAQLADMAFRASLQAKDQLAKFDTRNIGGSTQTTAQDPVTGRVAIANSVQNTQSPDSVASGQVQMRGQNMSDSRARERLAFDQGVQTAEAGGPSQAAYTKRFGKAEPGFRWKADGSSEPIPGGSKDIKANETRENRDQKNAALLRQADSVLETIKDSKDLTGYTTAGVGGMANVLPMTEARKLAGNLTTIKANLGFDRLQQMRDMSPTGGALGQVAVQELASLQATVAALDQLQKPSDLKAALEKIEKHYTAWRNTLSEGGYSGDFGGSDPKAGDVQDGYRFKGGNPSDQKSWEKM